MKFPLQHRYSITLLTYQLKYSIKTSNVMKLSKLMNSLVFVVLNQFA